MIVGFLPLHSILRPSSRYRLFQYIPALEQNGIRCSVLPAPERNFLQRAGYLPRLFALARAADVLFVQKRAFPTWVVRLLCRLNPRLVYDFDDAVYLQSGRRGVVEPIIRVAKVVIAGNEVLAAFARQFNPRVVVIPSVVDSTLYCPPSGARHPGDERVILGWIGSDPNRGDLAPLQPLFDWLGANYGEKIVLQTIGRRPLELKSSRGTVVPMRIEFIPWSLEGSRLALQKFDIGLMPLADTEWNRGKCGFKLIQYMSVAAPSVASPVGVNTVILQDGVSGFLATSFDDWRQKLSALIEHPTLRQQMGQAGRLRVEESYSLRAVLPTFLRMLHSV